MNQEQHTPTPADEAVYAHILSLQVTSVIQQIYADSKIEFETYNKLFEAAKKAAIQAKKLSNLLEAERNNQ